MVPSMPVEHTKQDHALSDATYAFLGSEDDTRALHGRVTALAKNHRFRDGGIALVRY